MQWVMIVLFRENTYTSAEDSLIPCELLYNERGQSYFVKTHIIDDDSLIP